MIRRTPRHRGNRPGPGLEKLPVRRLRVPEMINTPTARKARAVLSTRFIERPLVASREGGRAPYALSLVPRALRFGRLSLFLKPDRFQEIAENFIIGIYGLLDSRAVPDHDRVFLLLGVLLEFFALKSLACGISQFLNHRSRGSCRGH